jgi:hypothetical protein
MADKIVKKGSTNVSVELYIVDSTDGTPELGVLYNTSGIDLNYRRDLAAVTTITEVTLAALTTAHADGGFKEIANGRYRLDLPDAAFAAGVSEVTIGGTVTGMVVYPVTVQLVDYDPEDSAALGLTAVPATVAGSVGSVVGHTAQTADHAAGIADIPTVAELNARTLVAASYFDPAADTVANVTAVATLTGHTAQTADHAAGIADIPTVAEFNARTLASADYFDPAADTVANVTLVATTTTNTDLVSVSDILTTQMTESYATDGTAPTLAQAIFNLQQTLGDFAITGTTISVKKIDGSTEAMTYTLDDATTPTSRTRAT